MADDPLNEDITGTAEVIAAGTDDPKIQAMAARMSETQKKGAEETGKAEEDYARSIKESRERSESMRPQRPQIPEFKQPRDPLMPPIGSKDVMDWVKFAGNAVMIAGIIGSAAVSRNSTAGMNAMSAYLNGLKSGRDQAADNAFKAYQTHVNNMIKEYGMEIKEYDEILYSDKITTAEKFQAWKLTANKYQSALAQQAKSIKDMYNYLAQLKKNNDANKRAAAKGGKVKEDKDIAQYNTFMDQWSQTTKLSIASLQAKGYTLDWWLNQKAMGMLERDKIKKITPMIMDNLTPSEKEWYNKQNSKTQLQFIQKWLEKNQKELTNDAAE